ncbi:MAG: NADPH:quinone oxidoreductase [Cyanobacteria bacterium SW_7_48_12]|jgi:NADPH:quinone reductase-like Zn-dependent oxidoreductase|nr:MAG: NADPH:quinone oxidoreductase [Cyanobacteria bacterium QH_10_48_56]PSP07819.1 MAG: NADPH:quinone oxidoreductase [Cyanobacteria bacterium SW_7_48_12]
MKAMVITSFGEPDVFEERDWNQPTPGRGEVLVKVHATSVNPADYGVRQGLFGSGIKLPAILGYDVSGVVEELGEGVEDVAVGDEVYYAIGLLSGSGANAEYHVTPASIITKKPSSLSHAEAASIPVAGGTAWAAMVTKADVRLGETVLIHGGAGGVGSFAVQIAKAAGAYVYATCGGYNAELVRSIGADRAIDYQNEDFVGILEQETNRVGVDICLDTTMGKVLAPSLKVTKANGRAVTITGVEGSLDAAVYKNITVHFVHLDNVRPKLEALRTIAERGQLVPVIGRTFPLSEIPEAHKQLEQGGKGVYGKIAIEVVPSKP